MNPRRHRGLIAGGAVFGVLLLAELIFVALGGVEYARLTQELKTRYKRLSTLHNRTPFPSAGNVKVLEENRDELEYHVGELAAGVMGDPFPQDAVEAPDFSARAQDVIERFRKRAGLSGVHLPASLEVGFAKYASGGAVPDIRNVPRLSRQLYSVERVVDVLVQSGVDSIEGLTRDTFEDRSMAGLRVQRRRPRRNEAPVDADWKPSDLTASVVQPDGLYYIERIGVVFSCKEDAVWRVLNRLAAAPHFMVGSEFAHTTDAPVLKYNPEAVKRGGEQQDETLKYLAEGILEGKGALSRPERIIAGDESVQVRLVVEVYNFRPEGFER